MGWQRPILTDSGGFQVFSLATLRKISEEGVRFRSPVDGAEVHMSPEDSMDVQRALHSDIAMAFDDCTALPGDRAPGARIDGAVHALGRARLRALLPRRARPGTCSASCRAACTSALRTASLEALLRRDWAGLAIGGLAVGEPEEERLRVLEHLLPLMPADRPRYLMGVGYPHDIVAAVARGVDMFDCVMPTRHARNGHLFTSGGHHQHPQCLLPARHRRRSTRTAPAVPASATRAPTCGTWIAAARSSACVLAPFTTCTSISS